MAIPQPTLEAITLIRQPNGEWLAIAGGLGSYAASAVLSCPVNSGKLMVYSGGTRQLEIALVCPEAKP